MIDNRTVLHNPELSPAAKGLWCYLADLQYRQQEITIKRAQEENRAGRTAIMTALRELEEAGLVHKEPKHDSWGMRQGYSWQILAGVA